MDIDVKELFKNFLNENGVYEAFNSNCEDIYPMSISKDEDEWFSNYNYPYEFISNSFIWKDTPEGQEFWLGLNNSWKELLMESGIPWNSALLEEEED